MQDAVKQIRLAVRQLARQPRFALVAIAILALGIGANTAIFTVVQSVLLAPLPYHDADRIIALDTRSTTSGRLNPRVTGADFVDLRSQANALEDLSYYYGGELGVQLRDHAVFTGVEYVTAGFPNVFGLTPVAGRLLTPKTRSVPPSSAPVSLRKTLAAPQAALGQTLRVEDVSYQIAGVLPAGFSFPRRQPGLGGRTRSSQNLWRAPPSTTTLWDASSPA